MASKFTSPIPYSLPPRHLLKPIVVCGVVMALAANKRIIAPGSLLYDQLRPRSPTAYTSVVWMQLITFWFLYGAHSIESAILAKKLWNGGVSVFSQAWWKWMAECFVGGQFCLKHFEGVVKGRRV